MEMGDMTSGC